LNSSQAQEAVTVAIESLDASGDGVARLGRTRVTVAFTIPGERVRVRIVHRRGAEARAIVEAILSPSVHRIQPRCSHFGPPDDCGGCTWQHIAYPEQLRLKSLLLRDLTRETMGRDAPDVLPTLAATSIDDPWGYRHKVHFVFGNALSGRTSEGPPGQRLVMGHYSRGSRRVFDARECPVHDARGNAFAFRLREACLASGVTAAPMVPRSATPGSRVGSRSRDRGTLRHLALRVGAGTPELMGTLVVTDAGDKRLRAATARALDTPGAPQSFHLNIHRRDDPFIFGRDTRRVRGPRHLREHVAGSKFLISPTAFFQTNVFAAEILVRLVLDALPAGAPVLDLYAGVGLFALPLARRGDRVTAIEENRAATEDGIASLRLNRVAAAACRFITRPVEAALRSIQPQDAAHVVLDPPREGCDRTVIDDLFGRIRPNRVAYVSCNPEALAHDLATIAQHGYRARPLQPVDMFPHTPHVETVALLELAPPTRKARRL
jgi:23S rRNA (uracil1939-C5)-methyltransferase